METIQKIKIEVPTQTYNEIKKSILTESRFLRIDLDSKEIVLKSTKLITIDGRDVTISRKALNQLIKIFGVSQAFYSTINTSFGNDSELTNMLFSAIRGKTSTKLSLVFNLQSNEIVKIYVSGTKLISDVQYFETLEKFLKANPGAYLRNIDVLQDGDITATFLNDSLEFSLTGKSDEVFTMGTTLDFINNELSSNFFTQRLVCSNGARITDKLCTRSVKVGKDIPEFMEALHSAEFQIHSIEEFKKRVNRLYYTTASLQEVLNVESKLVHLFGKGIEAEILMGQFDARNLRHIFGPDMMMRTDIHQYLRTNITMWDLTNQVTALSSYIEQQRLMLDARVNTSLQIIGGSLLFSQPCLPSSNIRQIFD